jgi:hypothetical protein
VGRRWGDAELFGGFSNAQTSHYGQAVVGKDSPWSSEPSALRPGSNQAGSDTLGNPGPLEFSQGGQNVELQFSSGRRAVDALAERDERDAQAVEFLEHRDEMPEIAAEPV